MNQSDQRERIIRTIIGSLEHLIQVQVDVKNDSALGELQNVVGLMFHYASEARKLDLTWAEFAELMDNQDNEAMKPARWREYLHGMDQNPGRSLH